MKYFLAVFFVIGFFSIKAFSHSGGTDSNGCHAGSQPYHCHNGSDDGGGDGGGDSLPTINDIWDINAGYQYHIEQAKLIPFLGASLGKPKHDDAASLGINLGLKHQWGWYVSYVSTSKSFQFGYELWHVSASYDYLGLGIRYPFGGVSKSEHYPFFISGSLLLSADH